MHILSGIITVQYDEGELSQADQGKMVCVETANHPENFLKVNNSNNNNNDKKFWFSLIYFLVHGIFHLRSTLSCLQKRGFGLSI